MHAVGGGVFFPGQSFEDVYIEKEKDGDRKLFFLIRGGGIKFHFHRNDTYYTTPSFFGCPQFPVAPAGEEAEKTSNGPIPNCTHRRERFCFRDHRRDKKVEEGFLLAYFFSFSNEKNAAVERLLGKYAWWL